MAGEQPLSLRSLSPAGAASQLRGAGAQGPFWAEELQVLSVTQFHLLTVDLLGFFCSLIPGIRNWPRDQRNPYYLLVFSSVCSLQELFTLKLSQSCF